jgi:hypothetical protein
VGLVLDELVDISTIKPNQKFDNPFVLSFLANTTYNGSFCPDDYYTPFEFNRITFTSTSQMKEVPSALKQIIIGGLIICRNLVKELLFNVRKYLPDLNYNDNSELNLQAVGSVVYNTFVDLTFEDVQPNEANTQAITMVDPPTALETAIPAEPEGAGETTDADILTGVLPLAEIPHDEGPVEDKIKDFLARMERYVQMQGEDERLPLFKKKFELRRAVGNKLRNAAPDLATILEDYVRNRETQLKLK